MEATATAKRLANCQMEEVVLVEQMLHDAIKDHRREEVQTWRKSIVVAQEGQTGGGRRLEEEQNGGGGAVTANTSSLSRQAKLFLSVRQCNSVLATFGDVGDLWCTLRLFVQMRKLALESMSGRRMESSADNQGVDDGGNFTPFTVDLVSHPPKPMLVTYSPLMPRAVCLGKPRWH